jgi:hypothetical protein
MCPQQNSALQQINSTNLYICMFLNKFTSTLHAAYTCSPNSIQHGVNWLNAKCGSTVVGDPLSSHLGFFWSEYACCTINNGTGSDCQIDALVNTNVSAANLDHSAYVTCKREGDVGSPTHAERTKCVRRISYILNDANANHHRSQELCERSSEPPGSKP